MNVNRILTIALIAGALAALASAAWAQPGDIKQQERDAFLAYYARTAACMRQASVAAIRQGNTSDEVRAFARAVCARGLHVWLVTREGKTVEQADAVIDLMTRRALDAATQPPSLIIVI